MGLSGCGIISVSRHRSTEAQRLEARQKLWKKHVGKDGVACTGRGASQDQTPKFVLNVSAAASLHDLQLQADPHQLDPQSAEQLETALKVNASLWLECVQDLSKPASFEGVQTAGLELTQLAYSGFDAPQRECLRSALRESLQGIELGQTVIRLQFGRVKPPEGAAPETPARHGSLSKAVIQETIGDHIAAVRACYEGALSGWPDLKGRVAVKFVIQPDGTVHPAAIASTELNNRAVECCVLSTMRDWQFPPPQGGGIVVVTYPFVFLQVP